MRQKGKTEGPVGQEVEANEEELGLGIEEKLDVDDLEALN